MSLLVQVIVWGYADAHGAVVARWTYDVWGNVLSEEVAARAAGLRAVRYRFQGRERSAATGLVNFRMRWYDPVTGRWLSKDPIGLSGGLNLYASCNGNPVNRIDPRGLLVVAIGGAGAAGASSGASVGGGIAIGYSKKCGWTFGIYRTGGIGSHVGASASFGATVSVFPNASRVNDMAGPSGVGGGSGKLLLGGGLEASVPLDGNMHGVGITLSGGVGVGGEGHTTVTYTEVLEL